MIDNLTYEYLYITDHLGSVRVVLNHNPILQIGKLKYKNGI